MAKPAAGKGAAGGMIKPGDGTKDGKGAGGKGAQSGSKAAGAAGVAPGAKTK
jgi:hypothetical protein